MWFPRGFATYVRWQLFSWGAIGWMLLEHWYCPYQTAGSKDVWDHGSPFPSVLFHHSHSSCGGEYLVLDLVSDLFTAVHIPKVNAHPSHGLLAAVKHSLSYKPWYHNHLESVSLLELYILSPVNRDKHPFIFYSSSTASQRVAALAWNFQHFFPLKNLSRQIFPPSLHADSQWLFF